MSSMIPCSFGSITLSTKTTCSLRKEIQLAKCSVHKKFSRTSCSYGGCLQFRPISVRLLQNYSSYHRSEHISRLLPRATADTDVTTEENLAASGESGDDPNEASEKNLAISSGPGDDSNETSPATSAVGDGASASTSPAASTPVQGRTIQERKSKTPRVQDSDLVAGATFTGTVRSIQPFGAFVDIGANSNGLVHISNLSDEFVKDVASVVSVGQEVKVRISDVSQEGGRLKISLTMREKAGKRGDSSNVEARKARSGNFKNKKPRNEGRMLPTSSQKRKDQRSVQLKIGNVVSGTVKGFNDSGTFISFPDGKEGFLPTTEMPRTGDMLEKALLDIGQTIKVRVLDTNENPPTLTLKRESIDTLYKKKYGLSTKAFAVAFRQSKEIASFLDDREKVKQQAHPSASEEAGVTDTPAGETQTFTVPAELAPGDASSESVSTGESTTESGEKDPVTNSDSVEASTESDKIDSRSTTPTPSGSESALTEVESSSEANTIVAAAANSDIQGEAASQTTPGMKADDQDTLPNPTSVGVEASSDIPHGVEHETNPAVHPDDQSISPKVTAPEDSAAGEPQVATSESLVTSKPAISTE